MTKGVIMNIYDNKTFTGERAIYKISDVEINNSNAILDRYLTALKFVEKKFLRKDDKIFGFLSGISLYNK